MKIFKFKIDPADEFVEVPKKAVFLSVQMQRDDIVLWYLVDPDNEMVKISINCVATGQSFDPNGWQYLGTVQLEEGEYVLHVWSKQ